jgi:trigger factor
VEVSLTLPLDYPAADLQGRPVRFLVDIKAAAEVSLLGDDSPELLTALGRGANLDAVMDSIRDELEDEAADLLQLEGRELVFDALLERARPEVPDDAVSEEIRRAWQRLEGEALARKNFDAQEQAEALEGWLTDPATRAQARRRLELAVVLGAIVKHEQLTLTDAQLEERLAEAAADFGLSASEVHQGLRSSAAATQQMFNVGLHLLAVEHVLERAQIRYAGA